jgi:hypothetical protein
MKAFALWIFLLLPMGVAARTIPVQSGEHDGFSRLVLELGAGADWSFGRTEDGYALRAGGAGRGFDVSKVYDLIPRTRIAAVWADPETGALRLRIGCACYAQPFEFQPGVLVIDVREGRAPPGSSFEEPLDGVAVPELARPSGARPRRRPGPAGGDALTAAPALPVARPADGRPETYDWAQHVIGGPQRPGPALEFPLSDRQGRPDVTALRDGLLRQLSDGAARGIVQLELPEGKAAKAAEASEAGAQLRVGQDLGLVVLPGGTEDARTRLTAEGAACPEDARLDLAAWGAEGRVMTTIAPMRQGLLGEFDRPDPAAVDRAIRYYLSLGFGAEARQMLAAFDTPVADRDLLDAMARIMDGEEDPTHVFAALSACRTAAALWAALETPDLAALPDLQTDAVVRSFSALPPHLRRFLGPVLAERFIVLGDTGTARALTDAMLRVPGAADPEMRLTGTKVDLAMGATQEAEAGLEGLVAENSAATPAALIALAEARAADGGAVDQAGIGSLQAFVQEYRGSDLEPELRRALVIALATAGEFDAAFTAARDLAEPVPDLWRILAERGPDGAVLIHAVLPQGADLPPVDAGLRRLFARRLTGLGLPDPALRWLPGVTPDAAPQDRIAAAEAELRRGDGQAVLQSLAGLPGAETGMLRAAAHDLLDQPEQAMRDYAQLGDADGAARAARDAQDWSYLGSGDDGPWADAAGLVLPAPPAPATGMPPPGPLARSKALLEESSAARAVLGRLLAEVPDPAPVAGP